LAKGLPILFDQVEKDVHALRPREASVVFLVRVVGVREAGENLSNSFHGSTPYHERGSTASV
jgi:hypothetical protein